MNVSEIDEYIFWNKSSASVNLRSLEKKGLITKMRQEKDERVVKVKLSNEGLELFGRLKVEIENDKEISNLVSKYTHLKFLNFSNLY
ncbi:MarR family winged helix-turn-helix transcriptional regulator [Macrococcus equi]